MPSQPPVIVNTTVISNFAAIGQLDRLRELFGRIHIPPAVYDEIEAGAQEGYRYYAGIESLVAPWSPVGWIEIAPVNTPEEMAALKRLPSNLHSGEAACLVLAKYRGWLFLSDDRAARVQAARWRIRLSGTLGCLARLVRKDLVSVETANRYLQQMQANNYRSPITDLRTILSTS